VTRSWALSGDLGRPWIIVACALAALGLALLAVELWRGQKRGKAALWVALSGALATLGLLLAVLRPVAVMSRGSLVGPRVVVLVDGSRSVDLPGLDGTRRDSEKRALAELDKRAGEVRSARLWFGEGTPVPFAGSGGTSASATAAAPPGGPRPMSRSDLGAALEWVARAPDERPAALVVLSDGRLDRPGDSGVAEQTRAALAGLNVPVHTVGLASAAPRDASIRAVRAAGAAVAHQPLSLRIEIGCEGGLSCDALQVAARELREDGPPVAVASGTAQASGGAATVELSMTLDRAGTRILEIEIDTPSGDEVPDNNKRYVTIDVARDRVRLLHVAGRPTYDVRALRMWLKADASVDLVAFFILRTQEDQVRATQSELSLIPFPVDELFLKHLPSFDAVILQDFDARPYELEKYLDELASYVDRGGGLIMVGGDDSFGRGHYAGTPVAKALPVELDRDPAASGTDLAVFTPRVTAAGRAAPVLGPLRALLGDQLPEMSGSNVVGDARPGSTVLLEHPGRNAPSGAPMPVLALGEYGSGRTIALTVDGSHRLLFSAFAASAAGRAHGAFWDGLLGWLMRDPRYEPAVVEVMGGCIAGEETTLALHPAPGTEGEAKVKVTRLGSAQVVREVKAPLRAGDAGTPVPIGKLEPGGYAATVEIGDGDKKGPTTRRDFACERGGDEWADSRPDVARLEAIAAATGGKYVVASDAGSLPLPPATQVAAERHVSPVAPPWVWTLVGAVCLGAHWIVRRRSGLD
jgi:uncharacterized membrane protein